MASNNYEMYRGWCNSIYSTHNNGRDPPPSIAQPIIIIGVTFPGREQSNSGHFKQVQKPSKGREVTACLLIVHTPTQSPALRHLSCLIRVASFGGQQKAKPPPPEAIWKDDVTEHVLNKQNIRNMDKNYFKCSRKSCVPKCMKTG